MFEEELLCDITIKTSDGRFRAQSAVLYRSPVFERMLNDKKWLEAKNGMITIDDIKHDVMYELVRYLYTDQANNLGQIAHELMIAADKYDVSGLKNECISYMIQKIDPLNFVQYLITGDQMDNRLKKAAMDFIIA
jgi:hypothetical protein